MRVSFLSTSRADRAPLRAVADALAEMEKCDVAWLDIAPLTALSDVMSRLAPWPDLAVVLGDRFELMRLVVELHLAGVPVAHLSGGDLTEGSQDDCFRHAITKLSHLHFPTTEEAARRILQMGEDPARVHMCGSPSVDALLREPLISRASALASVGMQDGPYYMVCMHPNTLGDTEQELADVFNYMDGLAGARFVVVGPNRDAGSDRVRQFMQELSWTLGSKYYDSLGRVVYLSLMKHCEEFVGNSSAALYEAPTLGVRVRMIGDRQRGRSPVVGDGHAAYRIASVLAGVSAPRSLLRKKFQELRCVS